MSNGDWRFAGRRNAVDVAGRESGILQCIERCIAMQFELRCVRDRSELGGLCRADDGNGAGLHLAAGRKSGNEMSELTGMNSTSSGMSSTSASGVCGHSTMLVIIRGPSSSSTTAIEYGG